MELADVCYSESYLSLSSVNLAATFSRFTSASLFSFSAWQQATVPRSARCSQADVFFYSVASETFQHANPPRLEGGRQSAEMIRNQSGLSYTRYVIRDIYFLQFICCLQEMFKNSERISATLGARELNLK